MKDRIKYLFWNIPYVYHNIEKYHLKKLLFLDYYFFPRNGELR